MKIAYLKQISILFSTVAVTFFSVMPFARAQSVESVELDAIASSQQASDFSTNAEDLRVQAPAPVSQSETVVPGTVAQSQPLELSSETIPLNRAAAPITLGETQTMALEEPTSTPQNQTFDPVEPSAYTIGQLTAPTDDTLDDDGVYDDGTGDTIYEDSDTLDDDGVYDDSDTLDDDGVFDDDSDTLDDDSVFDEDDTLDDDGVFDEDDFDEDEALDDPLEPQTGPISPGRATRSGPSYIGAGANIGLGDGDTALGETSFSVFSKIGLTSNISVRPSVLIEDDPTILLPVTLDFIPGVTDVTEDVTEDLGLRVSPFIGAGVAISTGDDGSVDFLATGGVDVPITDVLTFTTSVSASLFDNPAVGLLLGIGVNFPALR